MKLKLHTSIADQDLLATALGDARPTTQVIKVDRKALAHILHDHGTMVNELRDKVEYE